MSSSVTAEYLTKKIKSSLNCTKVVVDDLTDGCGGKFASYIESAEFKGLSLLQRQRLVNKILAEDLQKIHAFQMKTKTPEEAEAEST